VLTVEDLGGVLCDKMIDQGDKEGDVSVM